MGGGGIKESCKKPLQPHPTGSADDDDDECGDDESVTDRLWYAQSPEGGRSVPAADVAAAEPLSFSLDIKSHFCVYCNCLLINHCNSINIINSNYLNVMETLLKKAKALL